jgi:hypothetical protein
LKIRQIRLSMFWKSNIRWFSTKWFSTFWKYFRRSDLFDFRCYDQINEIFDVLTFQRSEIWCSDPLSNNTLKLQVNFRFRQRWNSVFLSAFFVLPSFFFFRFTLNSLSDGLTWLNPFSFSFSFLRFLRGIYERSSFLIISIFLSLCLFYLCCT